MNAFWKVNVISILYAFVFFMPIELFLNASRIHRLSGWELGTVGIVIGAAAIVFVILFSAAIFYATQKWFRYRKVIFWSAFLWLPYFILFAFLFTSLFPITNPADAGGPGDGFIVLGLLFLYPFYVLLLNALSIYK